MSLLITIIILSIIKLTYTIGQFVASKRLKMPVEKFVIGIDWGKPVFQKKFDDTELVIYPLFFGGFLQYSENFSPEDSSKREKAYLASCSLITMLVSLLIIGLIGINFIPSGKYSTVITKTNSESVFEIGDKIIRVNGVDITGKNTLHSILQKNRFHDNLVAPTQVEYYKKELLKLNKDKIVNGEIKPETTIKLPEIVSEGKITRKLNSIKLNDKQINLRNSINSDEIKIKELTTLEDLATTLADSGYDVIFTIERNGEKIVLPAITPDEFGNINVQYKVNTIYTPKNEIIKNFKQDTGASPEKKSPWHSFLSIMMMLLLISVLVLVHEAGHFLAARMFKIKVERFGFGLPFGPTIWEKQCGETLVVVHAFLLGGYVSFPDDDKDNPLPKDSPERFVNKPIYQRLVVVSAGVFANVICAIVIVALTAFLWGKLPSENYDIFVNKIHPEKNVSLALSGMQEGDKIVEINGNSANSNYSFQAYAILSRKFDGKISPLIAEKNLEILLQANPTLKPYEIIPSGTVVNIPQLKSEEPIFVSNDVLKGFEEYKDNKFTLTVEQKELSKILNENGNKNFTNEGSTTLEDIAFALSDTGCPINITVERNGERVELNTVYSDENGIVGVELDKKRIYVSTKTFASAITESCKYLYNQTYMLLKGLWQLLSGKVSLDNMHGVVAVVKYGGDVIRQDGIFQGLLLTALISLDLAIINFLPIPALDGGHVMFLMIEKIIGRPLDEEMINNIATVGFLFLILLMIVVLYNDIVALMLHKI